MNGQSAQWTGVGSMRHGWCWSALLALLLLILVAGCSRGGSVEARLERADRYGAAGDYRAALVEARAAVLKYPDDARAHAAFVTALYRAGQTVVAAQELERIAPPARTPALALTAVRIAVDLGHYQSALDALRAQPPAGEAGGGERAILEARALAGLNRLAEARGLLVPRAAADPLAASALAEILLREGDSDGALALTAKAAEAAPRNVAVLVGRGEALLRAGQIADAERVFTAAIDRSARPDGLLERFRALGGAVQTRLALGRVADAERALEALSAEGPGFIATAYLRGAVALAKRDYTVASEALTEVVRADEGNSAGWQMLGSVQLAQGNLSQAETSLRRAVAAAPDNLAARQALAEVQIRLLRPSEAVEALAPALEQFESRQPLDPRLASASAQDEVGGATPAQLAARSQRYGARLVLLAGNIAAGRRQEASAILQELPPELIESARMQLAAAAMPQGPGPGLRTMREMADASPHDATLQLLAASFAIRAGAPDLAEVFLRRAMVTGPLGAKAGGELAAVLVSRGRLPAARAIASELSRRRDAIYEGAMALALVEHTSHNADAALRALDDAARARPDEVGPQLGAARILLDAQRADEAVRRLQGLVAARPADPQVRLVAAELLIRGHRPRDALALLATKDAPQSLAGEFAYAAGRAEVATGDLAAGRRLFEEARRALPGSLMPAISLALLELREGHVAEALKAVREIQAQHASAAAPFVLEGDILAREKDFAGAAEAYSKAARLGVLWQAAVREFQMRALAGSEDAEAVLVRWLNTRPADFPVRRILAARYLESGRRELAIAQYERIATGAPEDATTLNNLAWLYHETGDRRALGVARQAAALAPDNPEISDTLGWLLVEAGSVPDGLTRLQAALAAAPGSRVIRGHVGLALYKAGRKREAASVLSPLGDPADLPEAERIRTALAEGGAAPDAT